MLKLTNSRDPGCRRSAELTIGILFLNCGIASATLSLNDIQSWVGIGPNSAGFVIDWDDGTTDTSQLWGYHWTGSATGQQMLTAIISADPHLYTLLSASTSNGSTVFGFGIEHTGDGTLALSPTLAFTNRTATTNFTGVDDTRQTVVSGDHWQEGWYTAGYWAYWTSDSSTLSANFSNWNYSTSGMSSRTLSNGDWDGWSFSRNFVNQVPAAPVLSTFSARVPLTINANTTTTIPANSAIGSLSISGLPGAWTGKLDLSNRSLAVQGGNLAVITNQIAEGYHNGSWNGSGGIVSSIAASDTRHLTAVGVMPNVNAMGTAIYSTFDGPAVTIADVLVKYTYYGDANLDGIVDGSDYTRIDAGYLSDSINPGSTTGWFNGDFNYDGTIDGSDYTLIDNAFNRQGASLGRPDASAAAEIDLQPTMTVVPEPTCIILLGLALTAAPGRRRRRLC